VARNIGPQCRLCRSQGYKLYLKGDRCKSAKCPVTRKKGAPGKGPRSRKGAKKSTPFAAQTTAEAAATKAMEQGLREVIVLVKGPGVGSEAAIRAFGVLGLRVRSIRDVTPIPHNGCRPPKKRRV